MSKFYGSIGFVINEEISPGVWDDRIVNYKYYGDWTRNTSHTQTSETLPDSINITNELSIVANPFARENFHKMRYVEYMGTKWKITNVEIQYPRLILSIGGVYNE
jgi:hypothetical protein